MWRRELKRRYGILVTREFHATEFVSGRGRLGPDIVTKYQRSLIFRNAFELLNSIEGLRVFSACRSSRPEWAFERLITRIQKTMETWDSHAVIVCDEGKNLEFHRLMRRMAVHNPVPVYVGPNHLEIQNIATSRILEDPIFKASDTSYFIQMADFVAYGLLRREKPLESKNRYDIHTCFDLLKDVVVREASRTDPMGIIR
jgi:hypothetical protein